MVSSGHSPDHPDYYRELAARWGLEYIEQIPPLRPETIANVPLEIARRYETIAVECAGERLVLAISNPADFETMDSLCFVMNRPAETLVFVVTRPAEIKGAINHYYGL